jgi:hypothetical protein
VAKLSEPIEAHPELLAAMERRKRDISRRNLKDEFKKIADQFDHLEDDGLTQVTVPLWLVRRAALKK